MTDQESKDNNSSAATEQPEATPEQNTAPNAEQTEAPAVVGKPLWMKIAIPAGAALIIGAGAFFLLSGETNVDETPKSEEVAQQDSGEIKTAYYLAFKNDFEVNLKNDSNDTRKHFMRIAITLMSFDEKFIEHIKNREPVIRAALLELYGSYSYEDLLHHRGKIKLRKESKKVIEELLAKEKMDKKLESVLVTQFVME